MKILVTGLCLQGNKGGPALALSLIQQLNKYLDSATYTLSVPSHEEFEHEMIWSKKYHIDVIENFSIKDFVPPFCFQHFPSRISRFRRWLKELLECDVLVEMSAISYVGPPISLQRYTLLGGRFLYFILAQLYRKPFLAWTQSYGPLSTPLLRFLAKLDLGNQPIIFCRGNDCQESVKKLLPQKQVLSFPDVAIVLNYNQEWGRLYIQSIMGKIDEKKLITISPSAVIYAKTQEVGGNSSHIENLVNLCRYLESEGYTILLVPHTYRPNRHNPNICDFAVSSIVFESLKDLSSIYLISEDLSAVELKSIISCAYIHIGARYHSIVAALSSGVPCLSLSWHPKYKDIMRMYGLEDFVYDSIGESNLENLFSFVERLSTHQESIRLELKESQLKLVEKVEENTKLFVDLIQKELN